MKKKSLRVAALTAAMTAMLSSAAFAMATVTDAEESSDGATLTYPVVKADAADAQRRINTVIEDDVKAFMHDIDTARTGGKKPTAKMSYAITSSSNDLLSLKTEQFISEEGAAHPMSFTRGYIFRLSDGKALDLDDIRAMPEHKKNADRYTLDAVNRLLAEPKANASESGKALDSVPKDIYLDADGHVHVLVQRYESASYATGVIDLDLDK